MPGWIVSNPSHLLHATAADLLLLNGTTDDIDGVLGHHDIVILGLEHLGYRAGILLGGLNEDLLTGLLILAQERRAGTGLLEVVEEDGLVLLQSDLGRVVQNLLVGDVGVHRCRGGGCSGCAHLLIEQTGLFWEQMDAPCAKLYVSHFCPTAAPRSVGWSAFLGAELPP